MARVFIGIGSNINPEENIATALRLLSEHGRILGVSTFYLTRPIGNIEQPAFYNGVAEFETPIQPRELKYSVLRKIEERLGRDRTEDHFGPRTIDLDILLYDDLMSHQDNLAIPSREILERPFIAASLCELDPDLVVPGERVSIREIVERQPSFEMSPLSEFSTRMREAFQDESRAS